MSRPYEADKQGPPNHGQTGRLCCLEAPGVTAKLAPCVQNGRPWIIWLRTFFAPQWCALFQPLNFPKWSEHGVPCTFWLGHIVCATTGRNCSSLIWPAGCLRQLGKAQCFPTFLPFCAPGSSFFWSFLILFRFIFLFSSLLWLFPSMFSIYPYCRRFGL